MIFLYISECQHSGYRLNSACYDKCPSQYYGREDVYQEYEFYNETTQTIETVTQPLTESTINESNMTASINDTYLQTVFTVIRACIPCWDQHCAECTGSYMDQCTKCVAGYNLGQNNLCNVEGDGVTSGSATHVHVTSPGIVFIILGTIGIVMIGLVFLGIAIKLYRREVSYKYSDDTREKEQFLLGSSSEDDNDGEAESVDTQKTNGFLHKIDLDNGSVSEEKHDI